MIIIRNTGNTMKHTIIQSNNIFEKNPTKEIEQMQKDVLSDSLLTPTGKCGDNEAGL